ncbi:MAG: hypothetical protein R2941_06470 [Desulfobacterales bacterium]
MKNLFIEQSRLDILAILDDIEKNQEMILIYRDGKPVASISPCKRKTQSRLVPHPAMSRIRIKYDPTEEMDQNEWPEDA